MPNIKSAKKQMRQDQRRTKDNDKYMNQVEEVIKAAKKGVKSKKNEFVSKGYSIVDRAAKKHVIHNNKASRLKARISRLVKKAS